jgi:hypothetical protein
VEVVKNYTPSTNSAVFYCEKLASYGVEKGLRDAIELRVPKNGAVPASAEKWLVTTKPPLLIPESLG